MDDEAKLQALVDRLNQWQGRPSTNPLVALVRCKYDDCGAVFPVQVQDAAYAGKHGGSVCGNVECRTRLRNEHYRASAERKKKTKRER